MDFTRRLEAEEWMDTRPLSPALAAETCEFLDLTHHWFGGWGAVRSHFVRWSARWKPGEALTCLDVGAGNGFLAGRLARWARARGFHLRVTALERVPELAALARDKAAADGGVSVLEGDFFQVDFPGPFDYVVGSLFLHHVPDQRLPEAFARLDRWARRGLLLSDLKRSRAGYWAVRAAAGLWGNPIARHDGPLSVLRAFTLEELDVLAQQRGLGYLKAQSHPFFRLTLAGEKREKT